MNKTQPNTLPSPSQRTGANSGDTQRAEVPVSNSTPAPSPAGVTFGETPKGATGTVALPIPFTLAPVATICGWCKVFLSGNRVAVEEFVPGSVVSHGICPACVPKQRALLLLHMLRGHVEQAERLAGCGDRIMLFTEFKTSLRQIGEIENLLTPHP